MGTIGFLLTHAGAMSRQVLRAAIEPAGMTPTQLKVLTLLQQHGPTSQKHLAELSGIDQRNLAPVATELERGGFITRTEHPDDRRAKRLALTWIGGTRLAKARSLAAEAEHTLLDRLSEQDRAELHRLLRLLSDPFKDERTPRGDHV